MEARSGYSSGRSIGHPLYNLYRPDVATLFPNRQNSDGAVGVYYLDTTLLSNGLHSIAWSVTDDGGRIEGIGSRLFRVNNPSVSASAVVSSKASAGRLTAARREGVYLRTGYDLSTPLTALLRKEAGVFTAMVQQMDRIELHLPFSGSTIRGCMVRGRECAPLPAGSVLAAAEGIFYWQLDPAFLGRFELRFSGGAAGDEVRVLVAVPGEAG